MGRITDWFRQAFNWLMGSAEDVIPDTAKLDTQARKMLAALERQKDAATSQMALTSEARDKLEEEVAQNEALKEQAKRFKKENNEEMLYRVMEMKLKSDDRIKELEKAYEALREASRQAIVAYKAQEKDVMEKIEKLELLKEQARINRIREEVQRTRQQFDIAAPARDFDRLAEKVRRKAAQLDSSQLLDDSEGKIAEMQVKEAMKNQRLQDAVSKLEEEMARAETEAADVIEGEYEEVTDDASKGARRLLSEPTFGDLFAPPADKKKTEEPVE